MLLWSGIPFSINVLETGRSSGAVFTLYGVSTNRLSLRDEVLASGNK